MSRVARAARVASRQRPEIITTHKTITESETGELYLINAPSDNVTITLPPVREGAYFRFQFMAEFAANKQIDIVKNSANAAGCIKGTVLCFVYAGSSVNTSVGTNKDAGSATQVEISDNIHVGSYLDFYCDGTNWQVSGVCIADDRDRVVFDA